MPAICPRCAKKHDTNIASRKPIVSVCSACRATAPTGSRTGQPSKQATAHKNASRRP